MYLCSLVKTRVLWWRLMFLGGDLCSFVDICVLLWRLVFFCGDLCSFVENCVLVFPKSKIKIIKPILGQTSVFWPWYMETSLPSGFLEKVLD